MPRLNYLFKPKPELFRDHHQRLLVAPDPDNARRRFDQRIKESMRVLRFRTACLIGVYLSAVMAAVIVIVNVIPGAESIARILRIVGGFGSSLTVLFVIGVFVTTRTLSYLEVDLYFFSAESRLGTPLDPGLTQGLQ